MKVVLLPSFSVCRPGSCLLAVFLAIQNRLNSTSLLSGSRISVNSERGRQVSQFQILRRVSQLPSGDFTRSITHSQSHIDLAAMNAMYRFVINFNCELKMHSAALKVR